MRISDVMTSRVRTLREDESTELASAVLRFWNYNLAAGRIARALVGPNAGEVARTRRAAAEAALLRPGVTNPYSREPHPGSGEESSLNARQRGRNVLLAFWPYGKTIANSRFPLG